jgi:hypothetical protein
LKFTRIWDLSLEKDEEEEAEFKAKTKEQVNAPADLPPQLLFVHQVCFVKLPSCQDINPKCCQFRPLTCFYTMNRDKKT